MIANLIKPATHAVAGTDANGVTWYCTGRAGAAWVSRDPKDAFVGWYESGATLKAERLNSIKALHGLNFRAIEGSAL